MPTRMISGEGMWSSTKIASCVTEIPATSGVYYPWLYPLADANGVLELTSLRVIFAQIAMQLPFFTLEHLTAIINDFHKAGLLFIWKDRGKTYGFWTNSDKPGRLPKPSDRDRYKNIDVRIPKAEADKYKASFYIATDSRCCGEDVATGSRLGLDFDFDSDLNLIGKNRFEAQKPREALERIDFLKRTLKENKHLPFSQKKRIETELQRLQA